MDFPLLEISFDCPKCNSANNIRAKILPMSLNCINCNALIYTTRKIFGTIYIASNSSMPGLLKIGMTTRKVEERLSELSSATGVPAPFILEGCFLSDDPEKDETTIHSKLISYKIPGKEFFKIKLEKVIQYCEEVCKRPPKYVRQKPLISKNNPDAIIVGGKLICPKCGNKMLRFSKQKGWHCKGCGIHVDKNGIGISGQ